MKLSFYKLGQNFYQQNWRCLRELPTKSLGTVSMDLSYEYHDPVFESLSSRVKEAYFQRRRPLMDSSFEAMVLVYPFPNPHHEA